MKVSESYIRQLAQKDPRRAWQSVRPILARTAAVIDAVEPGRSKPHSLRVFRAFLTGKASTIEPILVEALEDPVAVVAAWALFGLAEIETSQNFKLPSAIFERTEVVAERFGDYEWRGTLAESARDWEAADQEVRAEDASKS